ncbi:Zinc finger family protein / RNA recognition motif-containing protein isoform 6 [Hibiscus syriacus]|uniref:Zinc finger family protein / RNA recognition motif-containing protein isoform 6 n=1 Tax=Hibiscus syriacus TaxID=106335 RepID=A0A6A2Z5I5_HIBSY|nr:Zinc finger family protein / RNA recognition motif-containing protein isoform 6 [Hibiscus syriacus]
MLLTGHNSPIGQERAWSSSSLQLSFYTFNSIFSFQCSKAKLICFQAHTIFSPIPSNLSSSGTSSWSPLSELTNPDELISPSSGSLNPSSLPFYGNGGATDMVDEFQLQDQLAFINESSPQNHDFFYPQATDLSSSSTYWGTSSFHRRSSSVSDILGADDQASGFIHGGLGESGSMVTGADGATIVGSPSKIEMDQCHELLRSKSAQQHGFAAASQLIGSTSFPPYSPKCMNSFLQKQQNDSQRAAAAAAAIMMGDDTNKFSRSRLERNVFSINGEASMVTPASRQIYLTFPADSNFIEEDGTLISFAMLVSGEALQGERKSPGQETAANGKRRFLSLWLMGLQLHGAKKNHHHGALSIGSPIPSPTHSPNMFNQSLVLHQFHNSQEAPQENCSSPVPALSTNASEKQVVSTGTDAGKASSGEENVTGKESPHLEYGNLPESLEHNLPDNPFASPTKASGEYLSAFSSTEAVGDESVSASSATNNWVPSTLLPAIMH